MSKIFLITYNKDINFDSQMFHYYITSLFPKYFSDWWHHINDIYLVATNLNVNEIYSLVYKGVPDRNLLIIEVNPNNAQGWLPKMAWDWLQKYQN